VTNRVRLEPAAARSLSKLRGATFVAVRGVLLALGDDPRPAGCRKIAGRDLYRIRLRIDGIPWRVVYQVRDAEKVVLVIRVSRRDEATYRRI
jgi:mRNA interferase RelE/StbE